MKGKVNIIQDSILVRKRQIERENKVFEVECKVTDSLGKRYRGIMLQCKKIPTQMWLFHVHSVSQEFEFLP